MAAFERALQVEPDMVGALFGISWVLSTTPDDTLRDARRAFPFAFKAVDVSDGQSIDPLNALAAAYAGLGRFEAAVAAQEKAIALARQSGMSTSEMEKRKELFEDGKIYIQ